MDLTTHWAGFLAIAIFIGAYVLVILEENIHLRKSKPVIVAAGFIWILVAIAYSLAGDTHTAEELVRHNLLEFAELFLFLLAAMTFINTMEERGIFEVLRAWLINQGFSLRQVFWITGGIAFLMSPVADNLATALLMATVAISVGGNNHRFVALACINIVVAANAGGAFSPFGDITTLMVWQHEHVEFGGFFALILPSIVNWLVTAGLISFALPSGKPDPMHEEAHLKHGAMMVVVLFILTISLAVSMHNYLHMPPVIGMMTGLGFLKLFGYYLKRRKNELVPHGAREDSALGSEAIHTGVSYDIYASLQKAEWDTLMFFYGVILCVGGLGAFGYLAMGSELMYSGLGPTVSNVLVGIASALVDNIPVMFAVLAMDPDMNQGQWLLVTLTAGVGGSMLSIGSAAGVAVMGQARGIYTFFTHLKWTWAIAIGYAASIAVHFWVNAGLF
jgi:Na+/H+ antiporter NhaD/arsenite permease-like protein